MRKNNVRDGKIIITLLVLSFFFIFFIFFSNLPASASEENDSSNLTVGASSQNPLLDNASITTDKNIYFNGEAAIISLYSVPANTAVKLTVISSNGFVFVAVEEESSIYSFTETGEVGTYTVIADLSIENETQTLSKEFTVTEQVPEIEPEIESEIEPEVLPEPNNGNVGEFNLNDASLSVDRSIYSLDDPVHIRLVVLQDIIKEFTIMSPEMSFYSILPTDSGNYEFKPDSTGTYVISVSLDNGSSTRDLEAGFEVIDLDLETIFEEPEHGDIRINEPVTWTQHIFVKNNKDVPISNYQMDIPLPSDHSDLSSDVELTFMIDNKNSILIDLAPGESMDFMISYQTSPVRTDVSYEIVEISYLMPSGAFDIYFYDNFETGDDVPSLTLSSKSDVKHMLVWHNSFIPYRNVPISIPVDESDSAVFEVVDGNKYEVVTSITDGIASWVIPELLYKTFMIMNVGHVQENIEIDKPVEWQIDISGTIIKYKTPAPYKIESEPVIENGLWKKEIVIGSDASVHYTDVIAFTVLPTDVKLIPKKQESVVLKLYLVEQGSRIDVTDDPLYNVSLLDIDGDLIFDQLRWNVPSLSSRTFEVEYSVAKITSPLKANKTHFRMDENPEFIFDYTVEEENKDSKASPNSMAPQASMASSNVKKEIPPRIIETGKIKSGVYNADGKLSNIKSEMTELPDGKVSIKLPKERGFRAGIYTLKVEYVKDGISYIQELEFQWGLVSLNTRKSIYKPGEVAEFIVVVLDKDGHPVSNADISLMVFDPNNGTTGNSTGDGTITLTDESGVYAANYPTETEGNHTIDITASFDGIEVFFNTFFLVQQEYDFDIVRIAKSKIDPTIQDTFDVRLDIESYTGANIITIEEFVPSVFEISNTDASITTIDDVKILTWDKTIIENRTSVAYSYSVPHIWPYLYALGPSEIVYGGETFTEARPWYVAVDPLVGGGWWNNSWNYVKQLNVSVGSNVPYNNYSGYTVEFNVNTNALVSAGKMRADANDLRIVYNNGTENIEIDRDLYDNNTVTTKVRFKLQANISASSSDSNYYMYYNYSEASSAPSNKSNIYLWYDDASSDRESGYTQGRVDESAHGGAWGNNIIWDAAGYYAFDTNDNFADSMRPTGLSERDVYTEYEEYQTNAYATDMTSGPIVRWEGTGSGVTEASSHWYYYEMAYSAYLGGNYPSHDDITADDKGSVVVSNGLLGTYPQTSWTRIGIAAWDINPTNLAAWYDATPTDNESGGWVSWRFSGTHDGASDNENTGQAGLWVQQDAGRLRNIIVRRYTNPEPTVSVGAEEAGDFIAPTYSLGQINSTLAGQNVLFSLYWTDETALSGYIFSFDNGTGTFKNDSFVSMTGTGNWSNVTKTINSTVGTTIRWRVFANDTSNNWANNSMSFIVNNPPSVNLNSPANNSIVSNNWAILNATVTDADPMTVYFYANTNSNGLNASDGLVYFKKNVTTGTTVTYNLTALPTNMSLYRDNLYLLYHLDNRSEFGENNESIYDFSGNGRNATISWWIDIAYKPVLVDNAKLGGGIKQIEDACNGWFAHSDSTTRLHNFTISMWINSTQPTTAGYLVGQGIPGSAVLITESNNLSYVNSANTRFYSNTEFPRNEWHHVVFTRDNSSGQGNFTFYLDGIYDGEFTDSKSIIPRTFGEAGCVAYSGYFDEIAIWDITMTQTEVQSLSQLKPQTYYWKANATDGSLSNESGKWEFTIDTTRPVTTLNSPANQSMISRNYTVLNATVTDEGNDNTTVYIYANTNSNGLNTSDGLVYIAENVTNASDVTYNLTALPVKSSEDGLLLLYHFDNRSDYGENNTYVYDFSGNGNNGTMTTPNIPFASDAGKFAGAFNYTGTGIRGFNSLVPQLNASSSFTFMAWVKAVEVVGFGETIFSRGTVFDQSPAIYGTSGSNNLTIQIDTSDWGNNDALFTTQTELVVGAWTHLAVTWDGSNVYAYFNGTQDASTATTNGSALENKSTVMLGNLGVGDGNFPGYIDEVAIYNRSLSPQEILDHYRLSDGKYYWKVNATDGSLSNESGTWEFTIDTIKTGIDFVDPTPVNGTIQSSTSVYVNVSTSDINDHSTFIDWDSSLVGWWNFENVLSNGTVYDNSNYGHDGTLYNHLTNTTVDGKRGQALEFDGIDDYINISNTPSLNLTDAITVEAWIKIKNRVFFDGIVSKDYSTAWYFGTANSNNSLSVFINGASRAATVPDVYNINEWTHVAFTYDMNAGGTDEVKIYLNGNVNAIGDYSTPIGTNNFNISISNNYDYNFNGSIDEVKIYSRALSPEEINASYNAGTYRLYNNFTGLSDGNHNYTAYAIDAAGNVNQTETRIVTIDATSPNVILNAPENASIIENTWSVLNATVTDNLQYTTVYFYTNNNSNGLNTSDGLVYIAENVTNGTTITYNLSSLPVKSSELNVTGLFHFDNRSEFFENSTFFYDFSSIGQNGTCSDCPAWNATGRIAGALEFDGVDDKITTNLNNRKGTSNYTVLVWVKPTGASPSDTKVINLGAVYAEVNSQLGLARGNPNSEGDKLWAYVGDGADTNKTGVSYNVDEWVHIALVQDGSGPTNNLSIYKNGVIGGSTETLATGGPSLHIGANGWGADSIKYFNGSIDEFVIFNKVLSPQEILDHYRLSNGKYYWKVNATDEGLSNESAVWEFTIDTIAPNINFANPTPAHGIVQSSTSVYVNVTTSDTNNHSAFIDWNRSLVGWWNFENVLTDGTVYDNSSYSYNGILYNHLTNTTVSGKRGKAIEFDGVDDYINAGSPSFGTTDYSISAWIKQDYSTDNQVILHYTNNAELEDIGFRVVNGKLNLFDENNDRLTGNTTLSTNTWYHVCGMLSNVSGGFGDFKLYINGNLDGSARTTYDPWGDDTGLTIGDRFQLTQPFNGSIDEVMIFSRAISAQEINASYNAGNYRLENNFTGLSDGNHNYTAYAIDVTGNINQTETRIVIIDATPPTIVLNTPPNVSVTGNNWNILNATVTDANDDMSVDFYANSNPGGLNASEGLVYSAINVTNGSTITYNLTALPVKPSEDGLVALYHFDNRSEFGENSTHVYDFTGNGNNGTNNGAAFDLAGGYFAGAFDFGNNDYIDAGTSSSLNLTENITVSAWFKADNLVQYDSILMKTSIDDWDDGYGLYYNNGELKFYINTWSVNVASKSFSSTGKWHHVVGTYDGANIRIFIDGIEGTSDAYAGAITTTANSLNIGAGATLGGVAGYFFNGTIDEVAIYDRALSVDEILDHYRLGSGKYYWKVNATDGRLSNESETWEFNVISPDFQVTDISFTYAGDGSDVSETGTGDHVKENTNVTINATIHNFGDNYSGDYVYVGFYDGESGQAGRQFANVTLQNATGGSWISGNTDYYAVAYWDPSLVGTHNISVWADWADTALEYTTLNESNNNNSKLINVSAWQKYWGNVSGDIILANSSGNKMFNWTWDNNTDIGYIYTVSTGVDINWADLRGLGCDNNDAFNATGNDFSEADTVLNLTPNNNNATGFINNNITQLFSGGDPSAAINTTHFIIRGNNVTNVPIINSTYMTNHADVVNANFITGLLWDKGSGNMTDYYDGSQNLVFVGNIRYSASGLPGVSGMHNYEISIPSTLNATVGGDMDFYIELK